MWWCLVGACTSNLFPQPLLKSVPRMYRLFLSRDRAIQKSLRLLLDSSVCSCSNCATSGLSTQSSWLHQPRHVLKFLPEPVVLPTSTQRVFFTHIQKRRTSSIRIYKYQVVSRDLALSAFPFVRLFNTLQFRLAMYSHARAQRHLFGVSSRRQRRYRRREGGSSLDRVDEAGILICDVRQGRLIGASLCGLYLLCFVLDLC
jgi:hypothetical protein